MSAMEGICRGGRFLGSRRTRGGTTADSKTYTRLHGVAEVQQGLVEVVHRQHRFRREQIQSTSGRGTEKDTASGGVLGGPGVSESCVAEVRMLANLSSVWLPLSKNSDAHTCPPTFTAQCWTAKSTDTVTKIFRGRSITLEMPCVRWLLVRASSTLS